MPLSPDQCIQFAEQCDAMSKTARDEAHRKQLTEMAAQWRLLAAAVYARAAPKPH